MGALYPIVIDINGIFRGKRLPAETADKVFSGGLKMPASTLHVDVWGYDALDSGLVLETGDRDGTLVPTERGPLPLTWSDDDISLLPCQLELQEGGISEIDGRFQLQRVLERFEAKGLSPVCATELEFYLFDPMTDDLTPPMVPGTGQRAKSGALYSIDLLEAFKGFTDDLYAACKAWNIPADAAISESGTGQFEVNLMHGEALKAADDAALFKFIVRGVARKHGLGATFMAKPYGHDAGNGFHMHCSILNGDGKNIFDDGSAEGGPKLGQAVAGQLEAMRASTLLFAPHLNSFRRLREGSHAPTTVAWGLDNRTAAIRIPSGAGPSRRFEHRVSGADANPYLVIAAILAGALQGLEQAKSPPAPFEGNSYDQDLPRLPGSWQEALQAFKESEFAQQVFGPNFVRAYSAAKKQEIEAFADRVTPFEIETYGAIV